MIVHGLFGLLGLCLCITSCFGVYEAMNGNGIRVHKVEPIIG